MRVCSIVAFSAVLPLVAVLVSSCGSSSSSSSAPVVASTTIGPSGGVLVVDTGAQAGLVMTVPAGALRAPTQFRVVDRSADLPPEARALSLEPAVGLPFRIEPDDVFTAVPVTLRLPYRPGRVADIAPGNVRVQQASAFAELVREPESVDVGAAQLEFRTREFGAFQVVPGPRTDDVLDYAPVVGDFATLEGGFSFFVEAVPPAAPVFVGAATRWRIVGPGFDERLYFDGRTLLGRESFQWNEVWQDGYDPWRSPEVALQDPFATTALVGGTEAAMSALGFRQFSAPQQFGGRLYFDVVRLAIDVAYDRDDIGSGQRRYSFWLAPEIGLLELSIDGVRRARTPF